MRNLSTLPTANPYPVLRPIKSATAEQIEEMERFIEAGNPCIECGRSLIPCPIVMPYKEDDNGHILSAICGVCLDGGEDNE